MKPTPIRSKSAHLVRGSWRIDRRTMLRGVGAAMALPLLDVMSDSRASAAEKQSPVRLGYLYFPNGSADGSWKPKSVADGGKIEKLNQWMAPLEPYKDDLLIPAQLWTPRGNGHGAGTATWLTGGSFDERRIDVGGPSIDVLAARTIGSATMLPGMSLALRGEGSFEKDVARNSISWHNRRTPVACEIEPRVVFDRMFLTGRETTLDRGALDRVRQSAGDLRGRVSAADRHKLDEYLEAIRTIERRLDFAADQAAEAGRARVLTDTLTRPAEGIPTDHEEYVRLMLDLTAMAWWTDATRVVSFMLDQGQSNRYFNFIPGVKGTWHALSHWRDIDGKTEDDDGKTRWDSRGSKVSMYNSVTRWHHEQLAYLIQRLKSLDDGGRPLLDRCLILYGSSIADGHEHSEDNLPLVLVGRGAGGGDKGIRTGRYVRYKRNTSINKLHFAMAQRAGVKIKNFADATRPITGLT